MTVIPLEVRPVGAFYDELPWGPGSQPLMEALDANGECGHGRLPGDPSVPCGCWAGFEVAPVVELAAMGRAA